MLLQNLWFLLAL
uniref:Uncharacterized protein n=1 Tax=Lepeophtheirus salmonis TaxID=72036 RepID=A0A0K2TPJ9_LEPSM